MDEIWEKAVDTALEGQTDPSSVRSLTMDGVVKCLHGRLPPPVVFERFRNLRHLSIASIGVSSLERFPRLQNLQKLILSDNRISGGLEFLVEAGLNSLRDLDLSNNRIQDISDLSPLAKLKLVSLDLYECPVTRVKDYRSSVFGLIESLKYLDKTDAEGNERPESDDEEDEESDEDDDYDTGSVEVDCEDGSHRASCNGRQSWNDRVIEVDDDESDTDEAELDTSRGASETSPNPLHNLSNGVRVADDDDDEDGGEDEEEDSDWDEEDDDDEVLEVQTVVEDDDDDGGDDDDDDDVEDGEEVDNDDDDDFGEKQSTDMLASTEGEIDGDGEDSDDEGDDSVETGEENSDDEEDDNGAEYLVKPVGSVVGNGMMHHEEDGDDEDDDDGGEVHELPSLKRKRDPEEDDDNDDEDDDDDDDGVLENGKRR